MSLCFGNISYCFPQYLLLLFQIRSERDTPSSGWQPQAELSEVTKKSECNPIRSTFTTDTTFSFPCAYHQSKAPRYMSSGKTCRTRFFHPGKPLIEVLSFCGQEIQTVIVGVHHIYHAGHGQAVTVNGCNNGGVYLLHEECEIIFRCHNITFYGKSVPVFSAHSLIIAALFSPHASR